MSIIHDQICRLCAEMNQSTEDILDNNLKEMAELIYRYLSITVDAFAEISTKICLDCKETILNFHNFALKCENAQSFLIKHKTHANGLRENQELKSEFDLQFEIKKEEDISDVDYFDDDVRSPLLMNNEIKFNPENESLKKTTPPKKKKRKTILSSSKRKTSKRRQSNKSETLPAKDEKIDDNENNEVTTNGNVINIIKPSTSKRCKSNISKTLASKEGKLDNNDNMEETVDNDYVDNIKGNKNDEIIINGNVINVKKPIKDVATAKEIIKLSEYNEVDFKKLKLPPTVLKKARFSQMFDFNCHLCDIKFDEWKLLFDHTKEKHQAQPEVKCICSKTLKSWVTVKVHFRLHTPELSTKYRCDQCFKIFGKKDALKIHMITHSREPKIYGCDQCDKKFSSPTVVKSHKKIHEPAEKRHMFECSMCDRKFSYKHSLKNHIDGIHNKRFICDLCGSSFGNSTSLNNHIQTHGEEMTCMCDICDRGFKTQLTLKVHMKRVHRDNVSYTCSHCSKVLKTRATYRNHLLIHDEYPRFSCPFCDKKFKSQKNLKSHKKIHTGERPYSCPWCPKTFTQPSNFRMHKVQAHEIEFREYELKMLKDKEEFAKKLREKLAATSSKTNMAINVPMPDDKA